MIGKICITIFFKTEVYYPYKGEHMLCSWSEKVEGRDSSSSAVLKLKIILVKVEYFGVVYSDSPY